MHQVKIGTIIFHDNSCITYPIYSSPGDTYSYDESSGELSLKERLHQLEMTVLSLTKQVEDNKATVPSYHDQFQQVAFLAVSYSNFGPVTVTTNIPYPEVITNVGSGFVANVFQAPVAGTYMFSAYLSAETQYRARVHIVDTSPTGQKHIVTVRSSTAGGISDCNVAILQLAVGDVFLLRWILKVIAF